MLWANIVNVCWAHGNFTIYQIVESIEWLFMDDIERHVSFNKNDANLRHSQKQLMYIYVYIDCVKFRWLANHEWLTWLKISLMHYMVQSMF